MIQQMYKDTLFGRFIKALLSETPIPVYTCVSDGDLIVAGKIYYYKSYIIRCTKTGLLHGIKSNSEYDTTIYSDAYEESDLVIGRYTQLRLYDPVNLNDSYTYVSSCNYYDPDTHYHLGNYLRYYRAKTGINLFPFYNCYCQHPIPDVELYKKESQVHSTRVSSQSNKVIGFPIRIGRNYSIHIDCNSEVLMSCITRNIDGVCDTTDSSSRYSSQLLSSGRIIRSLSFKEGYNFSIPASASNLFEQEKNLWLVIQLPSSNDSSIVVYEESNIQHFDVKEKIICNLDNVKVHSDCLNPTLTLLNSFDNYVFSNMLVQYLIGNVICTTSNQTTNFYKIQKALKDQNLIDSSSRLTNLWSPVINNIIYDQCVKYSKESFITDQDGNVNRDVEKFILTEKGEDY